MSQVLLADKQKNAAEQEQKREEGHIHALARGRRACEGENFRDNSFRTFNSFFLRIAKIDELSRCSSGRLSLLPITGRCALNKCAFSLSSLLSGPHTSPSSWCLSHQRANDNTHVTHSEDIALLIQQQFFQVFN